MNCSTFGAYPSSGEQSEDDEQEHVVCGVVGRAGWTWLDAQGCRRITGHCTAKHKQSTRFCPFCGHKMFTIDGVNSARSSKINNGRTRQTIHPDAGSVQHSHMFLESFQDDPLHGPKCFYSSDYFRLPFFHRQLMDRDALCVVPFTFSKIINSWSNSTRSTSQVNKFIRIFLKN